MPKNSFHLEFEMRGGALDPHTSRAAADRLVEQMNLTLAEEAYDRIQARLRTVLVNPSGYYQSRVVIDRSQQSYGVSDSNVAYGGWLEGTDRRNHTTRFHGYQTFRIVNQSIQRDADKIVEQAVSRFVGELS